MKKLLFSTLLMVISNMLLSQQKIDFVIQVVDSIDNEHLQFVTVQLFNIQDNKLQYATITNENGIAKINNVFVGIYTLNVSCFGYNTYMQEIDLQAKNPFQKIQLSQAQYLLDAVVVSATQTGVRLRNDKIEFIPDSTHLKNTATTIDLLRKVPAVTVNRIDNAIKVSGDKNVLILIDGNLTKRNLESIPAEDIEKIEIINNPSAKYDFDVTTVLNIIIKEDRKKGLTFLFNSRTDVVDFSTWNDLQLDYDIGKMRFFIANNVNFHNFRMRYTEKTTAKFENSIFETEINTEDFYRSKQFLNTLQYGFDYVPNKNNFFNFTGNFTYNSNIIKKPLSTIYFVDYSEVKKSKTDIENIAKNYPHNFTIIYKKTFRNKHELSFNNNLYFNNLYNYSNQSIQYNFAEDTIDLYTNQEAKNRAFLSKIDYNIPINEKWKTSFGTQFYYRNTKDNYLVENENSLFQYSDYRISVYNSTQYAVSEKLNLQAGIRVEEAFSNINDAVKLTSFNYMPSFTARYKMNEKNVLGLHISRKCIYPDYYNLSSHIYYSIDSMQINTGNPYLKPLSEFKIQPQYYHKGNTFFLLFFPSYSFINNSISTKYYVKDGGVTEAKNVNINNIHKVGSELNLQISLFDDIVVPYIETEIYYLFFPNKEYNGFSHNTEIGIEMNLPLDFYVDMTLTLKNVERDYNYLYKENFSFSYFLFGKSFCKGAITCNFILKDFIPRVSKSYSIIEQSNYKNDVAVQSYPKYMFMFRYFLKQGKNLNNRNVELNMEQEATTNNRIKK